MSEKPATRTDAADAASPSGSDAPARSVRNVDFVVPAGERAVRVVGLETKKSDGSDAPAAAAALAGGEEDASTSSHHGPGYRDSKNAISRRLKRIEGQVRGVEKMVTEDRYCIDVLTQISAIQSGLKAVALELMDDHLSHCVVEAARQGGAAQEEKLTELSQALARLVR